MSGDDTEFPPNPRIGWRHEWGTLALLWAMVIWVSVTILGTKGAAASLVTVADLVVVAFVLAGGAMASITIVRAAEIPMLSAAPPTTSAAEEAGTAVVAEPEPEPEKPEAEAEKPEKPEAEAEKPEAEAEKPEAEPEKPEKPEAEAEAEKPEKPEKPEAEPIT